MIHGTKEALFMAVSEWDDRKVWQNPEEILAKLELQSDFIVADVGCGRGFFTIPLAYKVKHVYGIDVKQEKLTQFKAKMEKLQLPNIELLLGGKNEIPLPNEQVDLLISINTLHEFADRDHMVVEMRRVLKPKGTALISDFRKKDTGFGPPVSRRLSMSEAIALFEKSGFQTTQTYTLRYQYLLVFSK